MDPLARKLLRRFTPTICFLVFSVICFSFNIGDALEGIQESTSNAIEKTKESVSNIYEKAKDTVSDTYNKAKDTAGNLYDSAKDTVGNTIKDTTSRVGNLSQEITNTVKEQGKEAINAIEEKTSGIMNMNTGELVNKASEIKDWTVNEGRKIWKEMDEYPVLKSVVQIAARQAYESTVSKTEREIMLAAAVYEMAKDGKLESDEMMSFCDRLVAIAVEEEIGQVKMAVEILVGVSEASGLLNDRELNTMLGLYNRVIDISFYNSTWDEAEILELMYCVSESLPLNSYSTEEIAPAVERAIAKAKDKSVEPKQIIREMRAELGYGVEPVEYLIHFGLIIAGILLLVFGYRMLKGSIWLIGLILLPSILGISIYFETNNRVITAVVVIVAILASIFARKAFFLMFTVCVGYAITYTLTVYMISRGMIENIPVEWLFGISVAGGILSLLVRRLVTITGTSLAGSYLLLSSAATMANMIKPGIFAGTGSLDIQRLGINLRAFVLSIGSITRHLLDQIVSTLYLDRLEIDVTRARLTYVNLSGGSQYFYFSVLVILLAVLGIVIQYRKERRVLTKRTSYEEKEQREEMENSAVSLMR